MHNTFVFIRHAKTLVDNKTPIENWILTQEGNKQALELLNVKEINDVDLLFSSNEDKAYLTIKPLADKLSKKISKVKDLGEIKRPNSEKLTSKQYEEMKVKIFQDLDYTQLNWETANSALNRFKKAVQEIDFKYENKKILICAHGTVMTLYFAFLQNKLNDLFSRWHGLEFGALGIVKDFKVLKDIVKEV
ncbi:MAG TPA: histidine phosphatase family protein [Candidatus Nanoarchaeia archaeon]|nr:histidine phosphatase family protein [Candidatus Nanoarchaeia archaeon]